MKKNWDEDERFCRERLGIQNARGSLARRLRELSTVADLSEQERLSLPLSRGRFLVVDLETTGMKPEQARIIEVGAVEVNGFGFGRELASLVNPGTSIPYFITRLTGIHNGMMFNAPRLEEILPLLETMLRGRVLVAHNCRFDFAFLKEAWRRVFGRPLTVPALCTVKLSRRVYPELESHNLDFLAGYLKIKPDEDTGTKARHRALGDARITARALVKMCRKLNQEGMDSVSELLLLQSSRRVKAKPRLPRPPADPVETPGTGD
jgi:DNA polymerase-3 subunit epsilon